MLQKGDRVQMTEEHKRKLRARPGLANSTEHVREFGDCVGVVQGLTDYNNVPPGHPEYDPEKVGPEYDVRWQPSNLRYAYAEEELKTVKPAKPPGVLKSFTAFGRVMVIEARWAKDGGWDWTLENGDEHREYLGLAVIRRLGEPAIVRFHVGPALLVVGVSS